MEYQDNTATASKNPQKTTDSDQSCKPSQLITTAFIILLVGFALSGTAVGAPFWASYEVSVSGSSFRPHYGLWLTCYLPDEGTDCSYEVSIDSSNPDWYRLCQALGLVGGLFGFLALVCLLVWWCYLKLDKALMKVATVVTCIISAGTVIATVVLFVLNYEDLGQSYELDWCFYIACVGAGFTLLAALLVMGVTPSSDEQEKYVQLNKQAEAEQLQAQQQIVVVQRPQSVLLQPAQKPVVVQATQPNAQPAAQTTNHAQPMIVYSTPTLRPEVLTYNPVAAQSVPTLTYQRQSVVRYGTGGGYGQGHARTAGHPGYSVSHTAYSRY